MSPTRRQFLKGLGGLLSLSAFPQSFHAAGFPDLFNRTLMHIMLEGGPDFRHLLVPLPPGLAASNDTYSQGFWRARASVFRITEGNQAEALDYFQTNYDALEISGVAFGILKRASWLRSMLENGHAAIIFNVIGTDSRDHHHAQIVWESGDPSYSPHDVSRPGWGGTLSQVMGRKLVSVRGAPSLFANGRHPEKPLDHDNAHVISAPDMENLAFYFDPSWFENEHYLEPSKGLYRALQHYYSVTNPKIGTQSPYRRFFDTESTKRLLGDSVVRRLSQEITPLGFDPNSQDARRPPEFARLLSGEERLHRTDFARQLLNAWYAFACKDLPGFDFNVVEANYGGWDSHKLQTDEGRGIDAQFEDLFGQNRGLHTLYSLLQRDMPSSLDRLVIMIGGEFGRQLRSNGDNGTDHGRGNALILLGYPVNGGLYGTPFPSEEVALMEQYNQDILGRTGLHQILRRLVRWASGEDSLTSQILPQPEHELTQRLENNGVLGFL